MKRLIINADDFGLCAGVNRAVAEAHRAGALPSATLMATGDAFEEAVDLARQLPGLGVGLHLCLVGGRPLSAPASIPGLVGKDGRLLPDLTAFATRWASGGLHADELLREASTQLERLMEAGLSPTHLDTHKHTAVLPPVAAVLAELCRRYDIQAVRAPFDSDPWRRALAPADAQGTLRRQWLMGRAVHLFRLAFRSLLKGVGRPDRFFGVAYTGIWTPAYLERTLKSLPVGTSELMVHPGILDESLKRQSTRLREQRQRELEILVEHVPSLAEHLGVRLANFSVFSMTCEVSAS